MQEQEAVSITVKNMKIFTENNTTYNTDDDAIFNTETTYRRMGHE